MHRISLIQSNKDKQILFAERPNVTFTLKREIGRGASCIVYYAVGSDNTEHLLKEYYPKHLDLTRNSSGQIVVPADKAYAYTQGLARFYNGCERQKTIRLSNEGLKNFTCNVQGYYRTNGTQYIDMTCFNGYTYDKVQEKSVYNLMFRMKTLAQVIGNYHNAGLLHLDIKPENIYVRPEGETIEDVMLFDFDSVTSVDKLLIEKALSCTKTWAAPEQLLPEKRRTICPATDLFAIGEIIFVQLFGRHSTSSERRSFVTGYSYDHKADIFKDMNPKVFPLLDDLLCHTICGVVGKRYQSAKELIAKLDEIIEIAAPKVPFLKKVIPHVQDSFVGRKKEIKTIHDLLSKQNTVFVSGIGGIGKSELVKKYAKTYSDSYDTITQITFKENIATTIQAAENCPYNVKRYRDEKLEDFFSRKVEELRKLSTSEALIIVDNFDVANDPNLNILFDLGAKILITTRYDFSDIYSQFSVDALENPFEVFCKHYRRPLTESEHVAVGEIIDLVCGHTLTIELLAKQMMAGRVKPEKMLDKLRAKGIRESGNEKVRSSKDGNLSTQSTYTHIQALFDLSELDKDETCTLANLSLIPHTGISTELFHDWCKLESYECINKLAAEGWVQQDKERDYISLHPVVAELVLDSCSDYAVLARMVCRFNFDLLQRDSTTDEKQQAIQDCSNRMAFVLSRYIIKFDWAVNLLKDLAEFFCQINYDPHAAIRAITAAIERADILENFDYGSKLNLQGDYGVICDQMGDITQNDEWHRKAVDIYLLVLEDSNIALMDYDFIATIEQNVACAYDNLGDFENAYIHYQKAISVRINADPSERNNSELALLFNNIGVMYRRREKYKEACAYYEKALELAKKIDACSERVAKIYHDIGCAILASGETDLSLALQYAEESLNIRNKIWSAKTYYLAMSKSLLGELYIRAKCADKNEYAAQLLEDALLVYKEVLGQDNSKTKKLDALLKSVPNKDNLR